MYLKKIKTLIKKNKIDIIAIRFVDLSGRRREVCYPASKFDDVVKGKVDFDGSSVRGFMGIDEGTLSLKPDLSTFRIDPEIKAIKIAYVIADVIESNGEPYDKSPRTILKKALIASSKKGYFFKFGVEMEFYFLKETGEDYALIDTSDYCEYKESRGLLYELIKAV